ncbi:MAG: DUF378 domain-containing protein [Candidatus Blackburnbacteria bacterium]|nr:DUF378 domain-containing protein [Candidatus Blackburnbacteria bacterium]
MTLEIKVKTINNLAWWILVIGGINWGLVGLGNFLGAGNWNLVEVVLASWRGLSDLIYVLVGVSAVWLAWTRLSK